MFEKFEDGSVAPMVEAESDVGGCGEGWGGPRVCMSNSQTVCNRAPHAETLSAVLECVLVSA